jgi:DNA (cytosine-5)-methyltransferase 1
MLTFGELFAGIGGFSLGLERAGMKCKWQVEIDPYATAVLKKHWPEVPKWDDVRTFPPQGDYSVDLICGGFPCQDISVAGKGAGLAGARSGLWHEFARIIGELRPKYVVVENVAALLNRGMATVLGDLSTLGYDAEWHVIPACAVGAPHRRDRVWIVCVRRGAGSEADASRSNADAERERLRVCGRAEAAGTAGALQGEAHERQRVRPDAEPSGEGGDVAHAEGISGRAGLCKGGPQQDRHQLGDGSGNVSHSCRNRRQGCRQDGHVARSSGLRSRAWSDEEQDVSAAAAGWWESEPDLGRVAHGVPSRVDRLRCLGNAVVPQVVEIIGRAIIAHEERLNK